MTEDINCKESDVGMLNDGNDSVLIQSFDREEKLVYVNDVWKLKLGYSDSDINEMTMETFIRSDVINKFKRISKNTVSGEDIEMSFVVLKCKSGKGLRCEGTVKASCDESGSISQTTWMLREVSNKSEKNGRQDILDLFFHKSTIGLLFMEMDEPVDWNDSIDKDAAIEYILKNEKITRVNEAYMRIYSVQDENYLINLTLADINTYEFEQAKMLWKTILDSGKQSFGMYELSPGVWIEGNNECFFNEKGQFLGHVSTIYDISNKMEAQKLVNQDRMLKKISDFRYLMKPDGSACFPYVSEEFYEIFGLTQEDVREDEKPMKDIVFSSDTERLLTAIRNSYEKMTYMEIEYRIEHPTKGLRWIKCIARPQQLHDESVFWHGYFSDITEDKMSEEWIDFLNTALMNISDSVIISSSSGEVIYANSGAAKLHGYTHDELIGMHPEIFMTEPLSDEKQAEMYKTLSEGRTFLNEAPSRRKDGSTFICEYTMTPILGDDNAIKAFVGVQRDITARKKILEALKKSNERFEQLTKQSRAIAWEIDNRGLVTYVSNAVYDVLGYTADEVIGQLEVTELVPPSEREIIKDRLIEKNSKDKKYSSFTCPFITKTGSLIQLDISGMPVMDEDSKIVGYHGLSIDITDKVEMEHVINNEKEKYKTTLLSVGEGIISTDEIGKITVMNPVAEKLTGWTQETAIGKPLNQVFNIIDETTLEVCQNPAEAVMTTGESVKSVDPIKLISKSGTHTPIGSSAAPIKNGNGDITGAVIVFRDFSEYRERQKQIEFLSFRDPLTGLYNRRYMEDAIKKTDIIKNLPISVMVLDVNGLKLTNDAFGHKTGDMLLKTVADILKKVCRAEDIIARMGGDEFFILLPKTDEEKAEKIKQRIIEEASKAKLDSVVVSMAIGYSVKRNVNEDINITTLNADNQMYKEKLKFGKTMRNQTIETVLRNINFKYDSEQIHTERVSQYCEAIAIAMKMNEKEITDIKIAGSLHDIGKIMVPPELLNKPGELTNEEYEIIKRHPEIGYQILKSVDEYVSLSEYLLYHHERWDGNGYPAGLKGEEIPLQARIIAVADAYEAMTAKRPYQRIRSTEEAKEELRKCAGTQFDPEIVDIFLKLV